MKTKAAVLYETNTPLVVETLDLDDPKEGEVLVRIVVKHTVYDYSNNVTIYNSGETW